VSTYLPRSADPAADKPVASSGSPQPGGAFPGCGFGCIYCVEESGGRVEGVDAYPPTELTRQETRSGLEAMLNAGQPVVITTRSTLVARDTDLLRELARSGLVRVFISICTLDSDLARRLEPVADSPLARLDVIRRLALDGIPVGVQVAPVIPGLTTTDIEGVLEASATSGAYYADYVMLRLTPKVRESFGRWLTGNYPNRADVVMALLDSLGEEPPAGAFEATSNHRYEDSIARRFRASCARLMLESAESPSCFRRG
jgi:DNA repair photolyase